MKTNDTCIIADDFDSEGEIILGKNVVIERNVVFRGGMIIIGDNCLIREGVYIHVTKSFELGHDSHLGYKWNIEGREITIGHHLFCVDGFRIGEGMIGGGSATDVMSKLTIGNYCHLGLQTLINTAREVSIGNNVGFGFRSCIFTHGAWQNVLEGYSAKFAPVKILDNVWIPSNVTILPGVIIGEGSTIGSGSVIIHDVAPHTFVGGNPAKVIKDSHEWPRVLSYGQKYKIVKEIIELWQTFIADQYPINIKYYTTRISILEENAHADLIEMSFDETFDQPEADVIFYLTSYTKKQQNPSLIANHLENFLRRRGIKFMEN